MEKQLQYACAIIIRAILTFSAEIQSAPTYVRHEKSRQAKLLDAKAPEGMKAFWAFDKVAIAEGAIPVKYKELLALGVGFTTQCPYCIEIHSNLARQAGASDQEITEAVVVAAALRVGGAITHGSHAMKAHE